MRFLIIFCLLTSTLWAKEKKDKSLNEIKEEITGRIDKKITLLQEHKKCVETAKAREELTKCRQKHKVIMNQVKEKRKERRQRI